MVEGSPVSKDFFKDPAATVVPPWTSYGVQARGPRLTPITHNLVFVGDMKIELVI